LQQRGQPENPKFLVRYYNTNDNTKPLEIWLRANEVPSSIVEEWRRTHRKDGEVRKRQAKIVKDKLPTSDDDDLEDVTDTEGDDSRRDVQDPIPIYNTSETTLSFRLPYEGYIMVAMGNLSFIL